MQHTAGQASPASLPVGPRGITWRRIDANSIDAAHAVARRISEVEEPGYPVERREIHRQLEAAAPALTALAVRGGQPLAYGFVVPGPAAIRLPGGVLPEGRGRGVGRALLAWQIAQARAVGAGADLPISVRQPSAATRTAALLARTGFEPERTFLHLRRAAAPIEVPPLPTGLRSVPFEPRFDDALRVAKNRAFADHWRSRPESPDAWAQHQLGPWLRRDLSRLAVTADDGVVGFVVAWEKEETPDEVYAALVGTDPERRGQGIARALLSAAIAASASAGRTVVTLDVDARSATGADRLYASLGFARALEAIVHGLRS